MPSYSRDSAHTCVIRSGGQYMEAPQFGWWVTDVKRALFFTPEEAEEILETKRELGWEIEEVGDG